MVQEIWAVSPRQLKGSPKGKCTNVSPLSKRVHVWCDPSSCSKVLHTHLQDYDTAGPLYDTALKLSGENPLVQRACGLFLISSCRFPREKSRSKGLALLNAAEYRYVRRGRRVFFFFLGATLYVFLSRFVVNNMEMIFFKFRQQYDLRTSHRSTTTCLNVR